GDAGHLLCGRDYFCPLIEEQTALRCVAVKGAGKVCSVEQPFAVEGVVGRELKREPTVVCHVRKLQRRQRRRGFTEGFGEEHCVLPVIEFGSYTRDAVEPIVHWKEPPLIILQKVEQGGGVGHAIL